MKFLRRIWSRHSKLGRKRKKKQVWRRPTGRDNKMREMKHGYPVRVKIGYKTQTDERNKIEGKEIIMVFNLEDLKKAYAQRKIITVGNIGKKKKLELVKFASRTRPAMIGIGIINISMYFFHSIFFTFPYNQNVKSSPSVMPWLASPP